MKDYVQAYSSMRISRSYARKYGSKMMPKLRWAFLLVTGISFLFATTCQSHAASEKLAVKAGKIITFTGDVLNGGAILIENGKIKAIGKDIKIPYDFWVIDAPNSIVIPGMVECFTARGLDQPNESIAVAPWLDVYDAIDPSSFYFEEALRDGITTLLISQGYNTVIGGVARAVRPIGMTPDEMTVRSDAGIILSFAPKSGYDRMIQMATLRESFRELEVYLDRLAEKKYEDKLKKDKKTIDGAPKEAIKLGRPLIKDDDIDFKHLNLVRLKRGELIPFLYCATPIDVVHAVDTATENGFINKAVFVVANACYKAVDVIKATGRPVILHPNMVHIEVNPLTGEEKEIFIPLVYHKAGVPYAIRSDHSREFGVRYLWYQAARLVRNGIPRDDALKAITLSPAQAVGLDDRVGALACGLDGNLLILSSDPLEGDAWVEKVIIEGKLVYEIEKDYRLKELMTGDETPPENAKKENGSKSKEKE